MRRISMITVCGYHHVELGQIGDSMHEFDTIKDIYLSNMFITKDMRVVAGKIKKRDSGNILQAIFEQCKIEKNSLVVTPNLPLFLCCTNFDYWTNKYGYSIGKSNIKVRLESQKEYEYVSSKFFVKNGNTVLLLLENAKLKNRIMLCDSANYGLDIYSEETRKLFGLEQSEVTEMYRNGDYDKLSEKVYKITRDYVESVVAVAKEQSLASIGYSIGGLAYDIYRSKYKYAMPAADSNESAAMIERNCYIGARMESFGFGRYEGRVYNVDIASHYPYNCLYKSLPIELENTVINPEIDSVKDRLATNIVLGRFFVETDKPEVPRRSKDGVSYPVGKFWAWLCCDELEYAFSQGLITNCAIAAYYKPGNPLTDFMSEMITKRKQYASSGNNNISLLYKYIANSFIGKLGQLGRAYEPVYDKIPEQRYGFFSALDQETKRLEQYRIIDWQVERIVNGIEIAGTFPAISACVTSYARYQVSSLVRLAGKEHTLYVCSDTLGVDEIGFARLRPYISDGEKVPGKLYLSSISNGITIVNSCVIDSDTVKRLSGENNGTKPTPDDFYEAISLARVSNPEEGNDYIAVARKPSSDYWTKELEEAKLKKWTWHKPILLDEKINADNYLYQNH